MPCYFPSPVIRETEPNENGKFPVRFAWKGSQLDYDFELPCGKCDGCRKDQYREWGVRMYHESLCHERSCMATLTYAPEHLPEDGKLSLPHLQEFIKRMRHHSTIPLRYYGVGEYGDETERAHYHVAIFGEDFLGGAYPLNDDGVFGNVVMDRLWKRGNTSLIPLDGAACMYTAGYVSKKPVRDFPAKQSRKPPLGYEWAKQHAHTLDYRGDVVIDGIAHPIPSRYFEWFPDQLERAIENREEHARCNRRTIEELRNLKKNREAKARMKESKI